MSFTHLHVHTEYSLLDGFSNIKKLVQRVKDLGMPAVAITDHGTMYGVIEFFQAATKVGIKPIIGMEAYMAARGMTDRDAKLDKKSSHLLLLAENATGYQNLLKIASAAQTEGFYYYPRIDRDFLAAHAEGLIATSGCMSAEIPRALLDENPDEAVRRMNWYYDVFGPDRFYVELQHHNIKEITELNRKLLELGARYSAKYVATNDVHYINQDDAQLQDVLLAIQTGTTLADPNRMRMTDDSYYLRTPVEMAELFKEVPDALSNTLEITERCNVDLNVKGYRLPHFPVPAGQTAASYLRALCEQGARRRYGEKADLAIIKERLDYELGVIHQMGFDAYFLIVWDLCRHATERGIWYNARGSAAGSIIAYTLNISMVDPLEHGLLFERFLNPGRISMPDIDLDFPDDRRAEMMEYTAKKYGNDKVAQIITFGTMGARAALRDVARVMDIPIPEVDRIAKLVPSIANKGITLAKAVEEIAELKEARDSAPHIRKLIDTASKMEGVVRNAGTHAAGVVISDKPLVEYLPLHRPTSNAEDTPVKTVTQFEMGILDSLGMLKVDFLGLATLTVMARACEMIKERHGKEYNLGNIPIDDPRAFELIGQGSTAGLFQMEGGGMTRWLVEMKPKTLDHVIAMVALYRPGPMQFIPDYIKRMNGEEQPSYRHPALKPIFKDTYGIPVYQEQLMRAAVEIAGFTASEADDLRKAISKKIKEKLQKNRKQFIRGAKEKGIEEETANLIFDDWEEFARYGFNKSHAADYGVIAVQTAFLKAYYPAEYMSALLSAYKNDTPRVALYTADTRSMGIEVLPPDVNSSGWDFSIEDREDGLAIRFGMGAIKNVGQGPVDIICKARSEGPFSDLNDFAQRCDLRAVGKRALESLIKVGGLDSFGSRAALLASLDQITSISSSHFRAAESGQMSLFGDMTGVTEKIHLPEIEIDRRETLNWERELLGLFVSDHPLRPYEKTLSRLVSYWSGQLSEAQPEEKVRVAGLLTHIRTHQTRNNRTMGFATLEDVQGSIDLVLFSRAWKAYSPLCEEGKIILVEGKVDGQQQGGTPKILVDRVRTEFELKVTLDELKKDKEKPTAQPEPKPAPRQTEEKPPPKRAAAPEPKKTREPAPTYPVTQSDSWLDDMPPQPESFPPGWDEETGFHESGEPVEIGFPDEAPQEQPKKLEDAAIRVIAVETDPTVTELPPVRLPPITPPHLFHESQTSDGPPKSITIMLRPGEERDRDRRRIKNIYNILISYPGKDRFSLQIFENGRGYLLDFPNDTTRICPEMLKRLEKLLGNTSWRIEEITIL